MKFDRLISGMAAVHRRWRSVLAGFVVIGLAFGGTAFAANNSVQGARKDEGYNTDAPTAILIEANSGSVLFEKNADETGFTRYGETKHDAEARGKGPQGADSPPRAPCILARHLERL